MGEKMNERMHPGAVEEQTKVKRLMEKLAHDGKLKSPDEWVLYDENFQSLGVVSSKELQERKNDPKVAGFERVPLFLLTL